MVPIVDLPRAGGRDRAGSWRRARSTPTTHDADRRRADGVRRRVGRRRRGGDQQRRWPARRRPRPARRHRRDAGEGRPPRCLGRAIGSAAVLLAARHRRPARRRHTPRSRCATARSPGSRAHPSHSGPSSTTSSTPASGSSMPSSWPPASRPTSCAASSTTGRCSTRPGGGVGPDRRGLSRPNAGGRGRPAGNERYDRVTTGVPRFQRARRPALDDEDRNPTGEKMTTPLTRRRRAALAAAALVAGAGTVATASPVDAQAAPTPAQCNNRINNTAKRLLDASPCRASASTSRCCSASPTPTAAPAPPARPASTRRSTTPCASSRTPATTSPSNRSSSSTPRTCRRWSMNSPAPACTT